MIIHNPKAATNDEKYPHTIKCVIFDNDGTLLDTLPIYYQVLEHFVPSPFPEGLVHRVNGVSDYEACKIFIEVFKMPMTADELYSERKKVLAELLPKAKVLPGVKSTVNRLHDEFKLPLAVATGSTKDIHQLKISSSKEHIELFKSFDFSVCGDDVSVAKPNPEIFLETAKRLCSKYNYVFSDKKGLDANSKEENVIYPENILVVEDALNGIVAATSAGMASVFVLNDSDEKDFQTKFKEKNVLPTFALKTLEDFPFDKFTFQSLSNNS